jgi:hypothetical protein
VLGSDLFDEVLQLVKTWEPKKRYRDHRGYRDDLLEFLREKLNAPRPYLLVPRGRVEVQKETGRGFCDIAVAKSVGIELKKDFTSKSEVDRLVGQLDKYRSEYPSGLIVVLVGNTDRNCYEDVMARVRRMISEHSGVFGSLRIKVVNKGSIK